MLPIFRTTRAITQKLSPMQRPTICGYREPNTLRAGNTTSCPGRLLNKYTLQPGRGRSLSMRRRNRLQTPEQIAGRPNTQLITKRSTRPLYPTFRGIRSRRLHRAVDLVQANEFLDEVSIRAIRVLKFNMRIRREAFRYSRRSAGRGGR